MKSLGRWRRSMLPGSYVSDNGKLTATLQKPGVYDGNKLVRHYKLCYRGSNAVIARIPTLKEAERYIPS